MTIKVYEVAGHVPDFERSRGRRRRVRERERGGDDDEAMDDDVEKTGVHDLGDECTLQRAPLLEIPMKTAVNHCEFRGARRARGPGSGADLNSTASVSPDGRRMVAVGDTNEIFLFDVKNDGSYDLAHTFLGSSDAAFSSDWSASSDKFAVASQGWRFLIFQLQCLADPAPRSRWLRSPLRRSQPPSSRRVRVQERASEEACDVEELPIRSSGSSEKSQVQHGADQHGAPRLHRGKPRSFSPSPAPPA